MSSSESTSETTEGNQQRGFCHVCDRQVQIEPVSFTCSVCNGGFIELLDNTEEPAPTQPQQQFQNAANFTRFMNDGNNPISQLLPLLLGSMGQGAAGAQNLNNININIQQPRASPQQQPQSSSTRLQFIVPNSEPGAQVDLYGIINNVLSDVLIGNQAGRPAGMPGANTHIQFFQPSPIRMFQLHGDMRDYAWGAGGLDTIITQLLNQLENTGPPPASEQQLDQLPTIKISPEEFENKIECAICMEDFRLAEEAKKLPCKHCFHEQCIKEWLKLHGTCPVCRKNLNGEDTSQREYVATPVTENAEAQAAAAAASEATGSQSEPSVASHSSSTGTTNTGANSNQQTGGGSANPQVYDSMDFD